MRFTVVTFGTEGDTRPLVPLCRALLDRGHSLELFADRSTLGTAEAGGVPARGLAGDIKATVGPGGFLSTTTSKGASDPTVIARAVAELASSNTVSWLRDVAEHARSFGSDAILFSGVTAYVGLAAGEGLGIPSIGLGAIPISPTGDYTTPFMPPLDLPRWAARLTHTGINALLWALFRGKINEARTEVFGLPPRSSSYWDYPILCGISRHLIAQPADWPAGHLICGMWREPQQADFQPPKDLADFLAAGEPPIYVGFGSMGGFNTDKLLAAVVEAVDGRRALFYPGWSGIGADRLPPNFFVLESTPHSWLFPRCSVIVHHGGAGTSHTAAAAGVPSVVVPFAGDQPFWADRLRRAGVAPPGVPHDKLDGAKLKEMIDWALRPATRARAKELGEAMASEDGVAFAVDQIEKLVATERHKIAEAKLLRDREEEARAQRAARPFLPFYALTTGLSLPVWLAASRYPGATLMPGLPVSALMAFLPTVAAAMIEPHGAHGLLSRSLDLPRAVAHPGWLAAALVIPPAIHLSSRRILALLDVPVPPITASLSTVAALSLAFLPPALGEELGFLGYAGDPHLARHGRDGWLLQGLFWAAWHVAPLMQAGRPWTWIAAHAGCSVAFRAVLGRIFEGTDSVAAAALCHAGWNVAWQAVPGFEPGLAGALTALVAGLMWRS